MARHPPHEGEGGRLPAGAVGPDEPDLIAPQDDGGGLDEDDLMAVLLGDFVDTNHPGVMDWGAGASNAYGGVEKRPPRRLSAHVAL